MGTSEWPEDKVNDVMDYQEGHARDVMFESGLLWE